MCLSINASQRVSIAKKALSNYVNQMAYFVHVSKAPSPTILMFPQWFMSRATSQLSVE